MQYREAVEICGLYFNILHGYLLVSRLYGKQMIRLQNAEELTISLRVDHEI